MTVGFQVMADATTAADHEAKRDRVEMTWHAPEDGHVEWPVVPDLYEVWNWEGDKTVLPGKWASIIQSAFGSFGAVFLSPIDFLSTLLCFTCCFACCFALLYLLLCMLLCFA